MKDFLEKILNKSSIFNSVSVWILATAFLLSLSVTVFALRNNNQQMIVLRQAVFEADKKGEGVEVALEKLRVFVHSHMNTNLSSGQGAIKPPIQLKYTYERLQAAEQKKAEASSQNIYAEATAYCEALNPAGTLSSGRVQCVQEYVTSRGVQVKEIPVSLYQYDFVSPSWSPDLAGWSFVVTALLFLSLAGSVITDKLARSKLNPL